MESAETKSSMYQAAIDGLLDDVSGPRIPYAQQFDMLRDTERTHSLRQAVESLVRPGMRVLDLGCGCGILSLFAAAAGAELTALEIQRGPAGLARALADHYYPGKIEVIREEARRFVPAQAYDLILCEMIDTWLIRELQLQVMNHALQHCRTENGLLMPLRAFCYAEPVEADFSVEGYEIPLPHYQYRGGMQAKSLGEHQTVFSYDFSQIQYCEEQEARVSMNVFEFGVCNALRLSMSVDLTETLSLKGSDWFAAPLILPLPPQALQPGACVEVEFRYRPGAGFRHFRWALREQSVCGGD